MAKFKGGLYADLSNYNTSLPNTEVLLNFFKSNPIGYRSGGMVQGIAGGNPTGMRVTGGFLANAQKFAQGSSADYPFDLLGKDYYTPSDRYIDPLTKTEISSYYKKPERLEKLLREKKIDIKRPQGTFVPSTSPITKEDIPKWDKRARKFDTDKEKWVKFSKEEREAAKKKYVDSLTSQYTSIMGGDYKGPSVYEDLPEDIAKEMREGKTTEEQELIEGGIKSVGGMLPGGEHEAAIYGEGYKKELEKKKAEKEKKEKKEKKYKNVNEFLDTDKESTSSVTSELDSMKKNNVSKGSADPAYPDAPTIEDVDSDANKIFNDLMEKGGIKEIIEGNKKANAEDIKNINAIGKEYYGKDKDKDAPAWAMPLMMAGLQMAASDNPDMLGALGEGGIAGLKEYARGQKEKREDAKDNIELDLKKVDAIQKIKGRDIDIATLQTNMFSTATSVAASNMRQFREIELAKYKTEVDKIDATKNHLFKKQQHSDTVDLEIAKLKQNQNQFESTDAYNKAKLDLEVIKASTQEEQHELEIDLKYRDTGKVVDVMISDETGTPKKAEIRSYYDYREDKFKTEFIGWSPLSGTEFKELEDQIYSLATEQLQDQLDSDDYAEQVEELVNKLWKQKMIQMFGTEGDAKKALETDLEE